MHKLMLISLIISLAVVGLRIISSPGQILYFLRRPYDKLSDRMKKHNAALGRINTSITQANAMKILVGADKPVVLKKGTDPTVLVGETKENFLLRTDMRIGELKGEYSVSSKLIGKTQLYIHLLKPIIGCCTCMASVWTLIIIPVFFMPFFNINIILIMFVVAAFNSIIYAVYEKLTFIDKAPCPDCK